MRIILYTGKGGVGKTTVAAATALRAARLGYRTLVISTDPAHSLADSFDMPLGPDPTPIVAGLWGQEVDVLLELDRHWGEIQGWVNALMAWQGVSDLLASQIAVLPGMEELSGLLYIVQYYEEAAYDLLIVDCAPTGETLRLLSFPEMARWYMERIFPVERRMASILRPALRPFISVPMPSDKVFDSIKSLFERLALMRTILGDAKTTSVRLVVNPEKMVVKETQRTYTYLNLYGYFTDLLVCNRILPESIRDSYFDAWRVTQERNLELIRESFGTIPLLQVPLMDREVVGLEMLERMAESLFGDRDPTQVQHTGFVEQIREGGEGYEMALALPFLEKRDISLMRQGDELVIQAGHYRRNVILPRLLAQREVAEARMEGGVLTIRFRKERPAARQRRKEKEHGG
jgi:arsenite-transporting ATPase